MALTLEAKKAAREQGRKRELSELTSAQRIHRSLVTGRPPASELRTPLGAFTFAANLYADIKRQWPASQGDIKPGDVGVSVAYVTTDLSLTGLSPLYTPGMAADDFTQCLNGKILVGIVFGLKDAEVWSEDAVDTARVIGARAFINTKQVDEWLSGLAHVMPIMMDDAELDWKFQQQSK